VALVSLSLKQARWRLNADVDAGVSVDAVSTSVVTACSTSAEAAAAAGVSTLACAAPTTREKPLARELVSAVAADLVSLRCAVVSIIRRAAAPPPPQTWLVDLQRAVKRRGARNRERPSTKNHGHTAGPWPRATAGTAYSIATRHHKPGRLFGRLDAKPPNEATSLTYCHLLGRSA